MMKIIKKISDQIIAYFKLDLISLSYNRLNRIESTIWELNALVERRTGEFTIIAEQIMNDIEEIKKRDEK